MSGGGVAFDGDHKRQGLEAQNADLAEFTERIKKMFRDTDPRGQGYISRKALAMAFKEIDSSWNTQDLEEMMAQADGSGGDIRYEEFVDWFMEEDDPKFRKQLWQDLSSAFAACDHEAAGDSDDDDGGHGELLEGEEELPPLDVDFDQHINRELWLLLLERLDLDADEGHDIYDRVVKDMKAKGADHDAKKGWPMREYLEELKIERDDREGVLHFVAELAAARKELAAHAAGGKPKPAKEKAHVDKAVVKTMFDKVVRALDRNRLKAEDGWRLVREGSVRLAKNERAAAKGFEGREREFAETVRSFMASPPLVNATAGQTMCTEHCIAEVEEIIRKYEETGTKFTDPEWNVKADPNAVLYVDKDGPGYDCTVVAPARWKRLPEIVKNSSSGTSKALGSLFGGFSSGPKPAVKPVLFKGGAKAGDIVQGQIGTCFLLGAMGAVAAHSEEKIQRMFLKYDVDAGVYGVRFCVDGMWTYVVIDDLMPVDAGGNLLYASNKDPQECWVALLEKAYCKLHRCYEMCDGGQPTEAIFSMFGGVGGKLKVKRKHHRNPGQYFKALKQGRDKGWLMTTGFVARRGAAASAGKCGEAVLPTGLVAGHAYSVLKLVEAHGQQLVCCRNPWGTGEWTGKWSDENAFGEWTKEMKDATGYLGSNDGKFWMSIEDFIANTAGVDFARTFGPNWKKVSQYKYFSKKSTLATAQYDFSAGDKNEISFEQGDKIEVEAFTSDWWRGRVQGSSKEGFFPGSYVTLDDRPVSCFELVGTPCAGAQGGMTALVLLLQPNAMMERRWYTRKEDGLHYKDTSYPALQLVVLGPDGSVAIKKEGNTRSLWGELSLPGNGRWRIFALSTDGKGDFFTLRCYVKGGTATLTEVPGATLEDVAGAL